MWSERLAKPAAASRVSRSLIISLPVRASISVMIETATGRRTPSGVMTSAMPASRAGIDVDGVVADAEARDDGEPAALRHALRGEAMGEQDQRVEILELVGPDRIGRLRETPSRRRAVGAAGARSKSG